jgi:hypothetical protein
MVEAAIVPEIELVEEPQRGSGPEYCLPLIRSRTRDDPWDQEPRPGSRGRLARPGLEFLVFRGRHLRLEEGQRGPLLQGEVGGEQLGHRGQGASQAVARVVARESLAGCAPGAFRGAYAAIGARALEAIGRCDIQDGNPAGGATRLRKALATYQRVGAPDAARVQETLRDLSII